jgi:hypothetical protein
MRYAIVFVLALSATAWADEPSPSPPLPAEPRREPPPNELPPEPQPSAPIEDPFTAYTGSSADGRARFDEALQLVRDGNVPAACVKFAESWKSQETVSVQLQLARCREQEGKFGEAWRLYQEAAVRSRTAGFDYRARIAMAAAKPLEEKLAKLVVRLKPPIAQGTSISINERPIQSAFLAEVRELVDPGELVVTAKGPSGVTSRAVVRVFPGTEWRAEVPTLQERDGGREPLWIAGSAVLVVGGLLAAGAGSGGVRLVGGVAVAGGVTMFLLAPKKRVMAVPMIITNETTGGGMAVAGRF